MHGAPWRLRAAALFVITLVMAGCGGKAGPSDAVAESAPAAQFDESTGAIRGTVVDPEEAPIPSAGILLNPSAMVTMSAADGSFSFSFLQPGPYTLLVQRVGFEIKVAQVSVVAGEAVEVPIAMKEARILTPRQEIMTYTGHFTCRMSTSLSSGPCGFLPLVGDQVGLGSILSPDDTNDFRFRLSGDDYTQIIFESMWTPSSVATDPKMQIIFSYTNRTSTHWFANSGPGDGYVKLVHSYDARGPGGQFPSDQPQMPNSNLTLRAWMTLPFGTPASPVNVAYELRYEMWISIFYNRVPPTDYTAIDL